MKGILSQYRLRNTLIAGGLAAVGAIFVFLYVASYRNDVQRGAGLVSVLVAARDIPAGTDGGTVAGSGYLRKATMFRRNVVAGAISSPTQISTLAAAELITAGEQVTVRQFHSADQRGVLGSISGNLRALTLPGQPNQLLAGIAQDGDHVDVLANIKYTIRPSNGSSSSAGGDISQVASRVLLRDLLVLHAASNSISGGLSSGNTASVTLALTDSQAQKLFFAAQNGTWWLALRPVAKPADSPDSAETIQSLLGDGLGASQIRQLTNGYGKGSIGNGG
jgi:Flp pilus assembly protein CpaB